jgi:tetratricopeptide (TPR) repeat protein
MLSYAGYQGSLCEEAALVVGLSSQKLGEYQAAIDSYEDFIKTFPSSSKLADVLLYRAMTEHSRGNFIEASAQYQVLSEMFPNTAAGREGRGRVLMLESLNFDAQNLASVTNTQRTTLEAFLHPSVPHEIASLWKNPKKKAAERFVVPSTELGGN